MQKITYQEVVNRVGYFRVKRNCSLRETSLRLGYNAQFLKTIENGSVKLKVNTLLDFCDLMDITIHEFFYPGKEYNSEDKNVLELYSNLSAENKDLVLKLMKKLN